MWKKLDLLRKEYLNLKLQDSIDYEKSCMISIIYNSTKIKRCSPSETNTRVLLEKNITKGKLLKNHLMVKDHYNAFLFLKKKATKKRKITIPFIQEVNALVMKHTGGVTKTITGNCDTSKSDLRLAQDSIDKKFFPDFKKITTLLEDLCENINQNIDNVKRNEVLKLSADLHYHLVNIHPFEEGNGRTSRLMMNYIQLYHNEPLIKVFTNDKAIYIDALNKTEEKGDLNIFRNFICEQQIKFYTEKINKHKMLKKGRTFLF